MIWAFVSDETNMNPLDSSENSDMKRINSLGEVSNHLDEIQVVNT